MTEKLKLELELQAKRDEARKKRDIQMEMDAQKLRLLRECQKQEVAALGQRNPPLSPACKEIISAHKVGAGAEAPVQ
jgi:hypothetical protein